MLSDESIDRFVMHSNLISVSPHCLSPEEGGLGGGGGVTSSDNFVYKNLLDLSMKLFNILVITRSYYHYQSITDLVKIRAFEYKRFSN